MSVTFSVFTKPWKKISVKELGTFISGCGFDGIEFPLRQGFQIEPERAEEELPRLAAELSDFGLQIFSVAGSLDERTFCACAKAGIPLIRVMIEIGSEGYMETVKRAKEYLHQKTLLCERYGVKIGVQQHYGNFVSNSIGLIHLIEEMDIRFVGAIWDSAHDALAGTDPKHGLDIVWSHLLMVNFKNAYYERTNGPEASHAQWHRHFTTGLHGLSPWQEVADVLKKRGYTGTICLTAEYDEEQRVNELIKEDIMYAKSLWT